MSLAWSDKKGKILDICCSDKLLFLFRRTASSVEWLSLDKKQKIKKKVCLKSIFL